MNMKLTAHTIALVVKEMLDFFEMQTHPGKNFKKKPKLPTSNINYYLEGDPPVQVGHSVGHLYVGSLGGVTGVGGDPPWPL